VSCHQAPRLRSTRLTPSGARPDVCTRLRCSLQQRTAARSKLQYTTFTFGQATAWLCLAPEKGQRTR